MRGERSICKRKLIVGPCRCGLLAALLLATGCGELPRSEKSPEHTFDEARAAGFEISRLRAGQFLLTIMHRGLTDADFVSVYIEGDGRAWRHRNRLSDDPTPHNAIGLKLALRDPSPAVAYIARPCQYLNESELGECDPRYWSLARYAPEVIDSIDAALDWVESRSPRSPRMGLIGYSGGGTVAALIAARRDDVAWLVTLAANLDHERWTTLHESTPLADSLNAADYAAVLSDLPQLHLNGEEDVNVPYEILAAYLANLESGDAIEVEIIPGFTHECCWPDRWPERLCRFTREHGTPPAC